QQDQRRPHRGQLPPAPPQPAQQPEPDAGRPGLGRGFGLGEVVAGRRCGRPGVGGCPQAGHVRSAETCVISALRPSYDTGPMIRAATPPVRSITSVVGMPAGGTVPLKSSATASFGSFRLGEPIRKSRMNASALAGASLMYTPMK